MKIELYKASFTSIMLRFYLMMAVVVVGLYTNQIWMYFVGYGIVVTCMLGMKITLKSDKKIMRESPVVIIPTNKNYKKTA